MRLISPFRYIATNRFGRVFRPYAQVQVYKKDLKIYVNRILVVDTGADFTIFPRKDAFLFGIDLGKETVQEETFGIGGKEKIFLYDNLQVKLDDIKFSIPVGFLNRNDIPALLGRQHFLEILDACFINYKTILQKQQVGSRSFYGKR